MLTSTGRSRLLQLRRELAAARAGRDLLDRKREAIVRAIAARAPRRVRLRRAASAAMTDARTALVEAQIELGRATVDAVAFAQPPLLSIQIDAGSTAGVDVPEVTAEVTSFCPRYGPASGSWTLDRAGALFAATVPTLVSLASEEAAMAALAASLTRTARRLNALDTLVIPELAHEIAAVASAVEEEDRDESARRRCWMGRKA